MLSFRFSSLKLFPLLYAIDSLYIEVVFAAFVDIGRPELLLEGLGDV